MMIKHSAAVLVITIGVSLIAGQPIALAAANNYRATCTNIRGNRLLYQDNEQGPSESNKRLTTADDKMSGGKVEILFSLTSKQGTFTEYGNNNTGNALRSMSIVNLGRSNDMLNFMGIDSNGQLELITLYPKLGKAIWTTHNDRIAWVDRLALSKSFLMDCATSELSN